MIICLHSKYIIFVDPQNACNRYLMINKSFQNGIKQKKNIRRNRTNDKDEFQEIYFHIVKRMNPLKRFSTKINK